MWLLVFAVCYIIGVAITSIYLAERIARNVRKEINMKRKKNEHYV